MDHLRMVFHVLKEHQLFSKFRKCEVWLSFMSFIGHTISSEGVEVDQRNMEPVNNWSRPLSPTTIRSFFGLDGY